MGNKNLIIPPTKKDGITKYNTFVNNINNPNIFVITRDYTAIPKYKIWFKKIDKPLSPVIELPY